MNIELNMRKTSSLFNLSVCVGFILQLLNKNIDISKSANAIWFETIYNKISLWSNILGYMFQISDDILDAVTDLNKDKPNICSIIGEDNAKKLLNKGCEWLVVSELLLFNNTSNNTSNDINILYLNRNVIIEIINKIQNRIV